MIGALLALASAACFGLNNTMLRRGVLTGGVLHAMAITVPLGVPLFALACLVTGGFHSLSNMSGQSWIWMSLAGVVHFVVGRYGNYRATRALGATLSSPIQQLSVPISLVLAIIFLGEVMTPLRLAGFVLVMTGPLVAVRSQGSPKLSNSKFEPHIAEGTLWGAVCAIGYGASPLFIMKGLGTGGGMIDSLAGGFVSYLAATVVVILLVVFAGGRAFLRVLDRDARKWFALSGLFVFLSQLFRYLALSVAPVSVVVPIQRLSVVFRVIFSWYMNRDHEVFTASALTGIALSLLGAMALSLSTDLVVSLLPSNWASYLNTTWP